MTADALALLPEIVLALGAVVGLCVGSFLPPGREGAVRGVGIVAGLGSAVVALTVRGEPTAFGGTFTVDAATTTVRVVVALAVVVIMVLAGDRPVSDGPSLTADVRTAPSSHRTQTAFAVLVQLAAVGAMVLGGASDLLVLAAAVLLAGLPLAALAGLVRDGRSTEAALKYFLSSALFGLVLLTGVTVLLGLTGATSYSDLSRVTTPLPAAVAVLLVLAGLLMTIGGVPAHFWVPDAVDGTSPVTGAVLTTTAKVGGLVAAWRLLVAVPTAAVPWPLLVAVLAVGSMTLGNLAAFAQTSLRRLLAYSTISQVGYLLVPVAVAARTPLALPALLGYLAAYAVTNLAVFAVVAARPQALEIADQRGLGRRHPALAVALVVGLLGLVGTPPTVVFAGKLAGFTAAVDGGMTWLAAVAVLNSVASLVYYLRWIVPVFSPGDPVLRDPLRARAAVVAVVLAVASVAGGILVAFAG
ncbi:NADH-quinone oxidoreductase subunit N [Actinomycetospora endophytica]|uniref:NADH-quinone oxidoreductase subunit N n=1 Tax=Actinomycetospora endophytica TaxID=2291215 RepID=A0ABS8PBA3_9PSEU|nr:proton-conducting transporter membrane subunit [Actinomycetospora endophytica]MCD2195550.1 NADH-quinone oxidoreductase subunit N [Actinomycetospora endophytica]